MMQLPLSVLPAAAPVTDAGGLTGGAETTTTESGDAVSVFASLLTAMQATEPTDSAAADALGAVLVGGDIEATGHRSQGDDETPSDLVALVQSLVLPDVTTVTLGQAEATTGSHTQEAPLQASMPATVVTADAAATLVETPETMRTEPPAPLTHIETATPVPAAATRPAATPAPAGVAETPAEMPIEVDADAEVEPTGSVEALDIETTGDVADATTTETPGPTETDLSETDAIGHQRMSDGTDAEVQTGDESLADTSATEAPAGDGATGDPAGDERLDDDRGGPTLVRPEGGETSNQATTAATVPGETAGARGPSTADQVRLPGLERPAATQPGTADAAVTAVLGASAEAAAPTNVERADAPVTIERITLREMPTVVVDRLRAIDPQGGVNRAVVRLDPPELGRIMLEVVSNGDEISVIARADNAEAVRALVRQRAEIEAAVEALGLSISDFDVKQGDSQRQDAEQEARRDGRRFDDRRPAGETGYATTDTTTTEGELFL